MTMELSRLKLALTATNLEKNLNDFDDKSEWQQLGRGGYSTVCKAFFKEQHTEVAMKVLNRQVDLSEVAVLLKAISSDYIVNIKAVIRADPTSDKCSHIAMEMLPCDLQTLRSNIQISPERWTLIWPSITSIYLDICRGLTYLHSCGISHSDVKPTNILISKSLKAKVTDFGLARSNKVGSDTENQEGGDYISAIAPSGTLPYVSPELLENPNKIITESDDLYSYAHLGYKGITNVNLFEMEGTNITDAMISNLKFWVVKNKYRHPVSDLAKYNTPEKLKNLITKCWDQEMSKRKSFKDWEHNLQDQYNTFSSEERSSSERALSTAVTEVLTDAILPRLTDVEVPRAKPISIVDDFEILNELGRKLDPLSDVGNDWQNLAGKLGFTVPEINLIESRREDPTQAVLKAASSKGVDVSPTKLIKIFQGMNRIDCVTAIKEWLEPAEVQISDATDSSTPTECFIIKKHEVYLELRTLDVEDPLGNDWRRLADEFGLKNTEIAKIEQSCQTSGKFKTDKILTIACQRGTLKSYDHLVEVLQKNKRHDVVSQLRGVLKPK